MNQKTWIWLMVLGLFGSGVPVSGAQSFGNPSVQAGDGLAFVDSFDSARRTVTIGRQTLGLLPNAATSLNQQLLRYGLAGGKPFSAKFSVVRDGGGVLLIESIYVFPPKRK
jgi:hypothetical protein